MSIIVNFRIFLSFGRRNVSVKPRTRESEVNRSERQLERTQPLDRAGQSYGAAIKIRNALVTLKKVIKEDSRRKVSVESFTYPPVQNATHY